MPSATAGYQRWGLWIRLGHWSMALLFLCNYWLLEAGDDWHEWAGYALLAIVCLRCVRGFCGAENGRFRDFWPTPDNLRVAIAHFSTLHREHPQRRHTPVAGLMVVFLLGAMSVTAVSGWMQELDAFWGEDWVQNLHAWSADSVMIAVAIHVSAVIVTQSKYRVALIKRMLTG
ncbi:cytochrome B [Aestuariicella hydrocarbonica]|uniref:Cytochrome B n=1 Tax=Pseudomaricurvus hydrocarbonicus TaxID=1470433 RepID=A0A9E5MQ31_9GAMM|nr:cytochrome b/b6 domain-containing protein [Aestuariicella hydrocarbonica]NHO68257.1 cytochrome B [Aestuariicella hydrocarbonica]